jgi:ubiquitin-protein ligase
MLFIMNRNIKRIMIDYKEILNDPIERIHYVHDETNILKGYAMLIGRENTPYEDGYYFFEFKFPENYPFSPPVVTFINYDGTTRFNPNLYIGGKVCLSILNTWDGEKWSSCQSIKSVLLSLSILILNEEPLLNEPGITRHHPCFENYHKLVEYKNIEVSILKYLEKTNLPEPFQPFHSIMVEHFIKRYPFLLERIKMRPRTFFHLTIFNASNRIAHNQALYRLSTIINNLIQSISFQIFII